MSGLRKSLNALGALRSRFEGLLAAARRRMPGGATDFSESAPPLHELVGFGSNPGNLRMLAYAPEHLPSPPPLVVALHGCGQSAAEYNHGTGWATLADRFGFVVVYPEQRQGNNPKTCFSWFLPGDIARDQGEALSIHQMVEHAIANFGVDRRRVFVTGLSAGGAMASVMLATYPEVYAGGAIIAGLPYGSAGSVQEAFEAMFSEQSPSACTLGDRVRAASRHRGPWPKIAVWHGSADPIVKPSNAEHIVRQWVNVHGLATAPTRSELIGRHTRRIWNDANGRALIEAFSIAGMGHGVPLASSNDAESCGSTGPFFLDVGLSSTHHIARAWGLDDLCIEIPRAAPALVTDPDQMRAAELVIDTAAKSGDGYSQAAETPFAAGTMPPACSPLDPSHVIAAAFKAAGLPVPKLPTPAPGTSPRNDPEPIIEAALKAAGLRR